MKQLVVLLSKTFFPKHRKAGEPTEFRDKVVRGNKRHTVRCNYSYWAERVKKLQEVGGVLSIREWSGKAYRSPQEVILEVPASLIEVQRLELTRTAKRYEGLQGTFYEWDATVDGQFVDVRKLAHNDGLCTKDFIQFFNPVFEEYAKGNPEKLTLTFAVIHFTTFRY